MNWLICYIIFQGLVLYTATKINEEKLLKFLPFVVVAMPGLIVTFFLLSREQE